MKFLVIGLGSIGTRHARNLQTMGHEVFVHDNDPSKTEFPQLPLPWEHDSKIDGCIIASPTNTHAGYLHDAIDCGWHTFIEKPLADKVTQSLCDDLEYAKQVGILVVMGNMLRFHPNVRMARLIVKNPTEAHFQVLQKNERPDYSRDGVILNWGAHEIDLARYLLGPATVIAAQGGEECAEVGRKHDNGAISVVEMDYLAEPEVREFRILEEDGAVHEIGLTLHDWDNVYMDEMQAFVDALKGKPWPGATGEDGFETLKLIDAAREMAK